MKEEYKKTSEDKEFSVGGIGNFYGGLEVKKEGFRYYWGIEDHNKTEWVEIPKYLYGTLVRYEKERQKKLKQNPLE